MDIKKLHLKPKILDFIKWKIFDISDALKNGKTFQEFGLTLYCGRQGAGKTVGLVEYLERMRMIYPDVIIVTNFGYKHQTKEMTSWRDLLKIRNGKSGVIFAIDEIHLEYSSTDWKDFPEHILSEISQQRKQRIKIVASSQVFTRVVKQIREQAFDVVESRTIAGRWCFQRCFDADDYISVMENPDKKMKMPRKWRKSFIITDYLRSLYDTYQKVEKLSEKGFMTRIERGQ